MVSFADAADASPASGGSAWFCPAHIHHARKHAGMPRGSALDNIKKAARRANLCLVIVPTLITGLTAAAGAMVGVQLMDFGGLVAGTLASGLLGVLLSAAVSLRAGWIRERNARNAVSGGAIGLVVALILIIAGTATYNSPLLPLPGILLVGAGFLRGSLLKPLKSSDGVAT